MSRRHEKTTSATYIGDIITNISLNCRSTFFDRRPIAASVTEASHAQLLARAARGVLIDGSPTKIFVGDRTQLFLLALLSALRPVETSTCLAPDDVSSTEHSASLVVRRGTVCRPTFLPHQHCLLSKTG